MTYGTIREYCIFDRDDRPIFAASYPTVTAALLVIAECLEVNDMPYYRELFPVTIQALDSGDIFTTITTITSEGIS